MGEYTISMDPMVHTLHRPLRGFRCSKAARCSCRKLRSAAASGCARSRGTAMFCDKKRKAATWRSFHSYSAWVTPRTFLGWINDNSGFIYQSTKNWTKINIPFCSIVISSWKKEKNPASNATWIMGSTQAIEDSPNSCGNHSYRNWASKLRSVQWKRTSNHQRFQTK